MRKPIHVSLDIETFGTGADAVVLSVGVCAFGKDAPYKAGFWTVTDRNTQLDVGRAIDPETLAWWEQQSPEARQFSFAEQLPPDCQWPRPVSTVGMLEALALFFVDLTGGLPHREQPVFVWTNGPAFDAAIMASLYKSYGKKLPWFFSGDRCYRTLTAMARAKGVPLPDFIGHPHRAIDDAENQAKIIFAALEALCPELL
jgi:hypothetical protein